MDKLVGFEKSASMPTPLIVAIVCVAVVLVATVVIFLTVIKNKKAAINSLEKKYQQTKNILTGQDAQFVHRLETISRSNLQFSETYEKYSTGFRNLLEGDCKYIENLLIKLKDAFEGKNGKEFKELLIETKKSVNAFKDKLTNFDRALHETIKPEEDSRNYAVKVKEAYREVKQRYLNNEKELESVSTSFNRVFNKIDKTFEDFERHLECAEYQEADKLMPVIKQVVGALNNAMDQLPNLCSQIDQVIPQKITVLNRDISEIEATGVPVFHLNFTNKVGLWNDKLALIKTKIREFKFSGVQNELNKIVSEIDETKAALDKELIDKAYFEQNLDIIYQNVLTLEKNFLKIVAKLPELNSVYVVNVQQQNSLEILKQNIDNLGVAKRTLDNNIHSITRQPFSLLKEKLENLKNDYEVALAGVNDFKAYIDSIKSNSQNAYSLIFDYYYHLRNIEKMIRDMQIPGLPEAYEGAINSCYSLLNDLDSAVRSQPIDVSLVNEKAEALKQTANALFAQVEEGYRQMKLAESAIVFNNRDRLHQSDVHEKLRILENQFYDCEFAKVYKSANELYQIKHVEGNRNGR